MEIYYLDGGTVMKYRIIDKRICMLLIMGIFLISSCGADDSIAIMPAMYASGLYGDDEDGGNVLVTGDVSGLSQTPPVAAFSVSQTTGPVPLKVQFTDRSTGDPTQWGWYFGDGGSSHEQNPEHTYTMPGVYPVGFLVSNDAGFNKTFVPGLINAQRPSPAPSPVPVPGQSPPTAGFMASPTTGPVPFTVLFIDTSTDKPDSWAWYFGDGSYSPKQHPYHTYTRPGRYPVSLTAGNPGGTDTYIAEDYIVATTPVPTPTPVPTIKPPCPFVSVQSIEASDPAFPVARFSAELIQESDLLMVRFTDESEGDPIFRLWYFGDGSYATVNDPVYTYSTPGTYIVSLMVVNDAGSDTITARVEVKKKDGGGDSYEKIKSPLLSGNTHLSQQFAEMIAQDPDAWSWFFKELDYSANNIPSLGLKPGLVLDQVDAVSLKKGLVQSLSGGL